MVCVIQQEIKEKVLKKKRHPFIAWVIVYLAAEYPASEGLQIMSVHGN